jgi:general secretion pathway protein D
MRTRVNAPADGQTDLQLLLERARTLTPSGPELPDTTLPGQVATSSAMTAALLYRTIGQIAGVSIVFDSQFRDGPAQPVLLNNLPLRDALDAIARATQTFYQVTAPGTITVINDTPAKRREYAEEVIAVIPIQNADLKEVMDTLRVVADLRSISADTGVKAIAVRDTPERVAAAQKLVAALDKARPEIVVNVEILEIDRTRLQEYGLQLASPGSTGIEGAIGVDPDGLTLQRLRSLSAADVLTSNIPVLYYRLLKTDTRTRTLANPHIRVIDSTQTSANFGEEVPVQKTVIVPITQGGVNIQPQTTYEYRNVGVNVTITPRIHPNDEITLGLQIELSSLTGVTTDGLPTIGSRKVQTSIRLKDGQTNILAGLIRDDERIRKESLPGIGDVPVLGSLFARNRREAQQTDVVVMMTPHIVRSLELTEADLRPFRIPRDSSGIPGDVIVPPPPPIRGGGAGGAAGS